MVLNKLKEKVFGKKVAPSEAREILASSDFQPVFFLSTGRCGTRWFTELLETQKKLDVHHNTVPELYEQSLVAYRLLQNGKQSEPDVQQLLDELVYCARQDLMVESLAKGKRYVETNNRITFFTPQLARLFPYARFVHLYRDPAGFVKSGMNRDWYNNSRFDYARPTSLSESWEDRSRVSKIAWLWRETNEVIEQFLDTIPAERHRRFNFSALNLSDVTDLLRWLEIDVDVRKLESMIHKPVNAQKTGNFPRYEDWSRSDRTDFFTECGAYAARLGFEYKP